MPKLLISLPSGDISKEISGDVITIGRTPDNKVQIDHHSVSAHHARLVLSNGNYKIKDLDSTNRSCVNGIPVNDAELTGSCFLRFGTIECVYKADTANTGGELQSQLNELQRQMDNLIKARDLISQQNQSLVKERDQAKQDADTNLEQLADANKQIEQFAAGGTGNQQKLQEVSGQLNDARKQIETLGTERDALLESNKELNARVQTLNAQVEDLTAKLNESRQKAEQAALSISSEVTAAAQTPAVTTAQEKAAARVKESMEESVEDDFEEQELASVGQRTAVAGGSAGRLITGAPLIGSWLNRGTGIKRKTGPLDQSEKPSNITSMPSQVEAKNGGLGNVVITPPPSLRLVPTPQQPNGHNANLGSPAVKIGRASANVAPQNPEIKPAWDILNIMRRSLHYFLRHQDELKVLQEMTENAHNFTEMARSELLRPVFELAAALEALMGDLHSNPVNINPSTLRTVGQSIDFLATLIDEANLGRIKDVTTAKVFAIDDDEGILETIKATMEMAHLNVVTSLQSNAGLTKLSEQNYDLILLDVGIPEMSGMDICSRVRAMPHHQKTPIVFLTGEATVQNRVQSTLNGGNDMIGKPFSILELAVKAITWIFKGLLGLV
jgi:CheY-like chemotaxis protein